MQRVEYLNVQDSFLCTICVLLCAIRLPSEVCSVYEGGSTHKVSLGRLKQSALHILYSCLFSLKFPSARVKPFWPAA